jgi:hypothetical protein
MTSLHTLHCNWLKSYCPAVNQCEHYIVQCVIYVKATVEAVLIHIAMVWPHALFHCNTGFNQVYCHILRSSE